jgi:hypothetical protein
MTDPLSARLPGKQGGGVRVCGFGWLAGWLTVKLAGWVADGKTSGFDPQVYPLANVESDM